MDWIRGGSNEGDAPLPSQSVRSDPHNTPSNEIIGEYRPN